MYKTVSQLDAGGYFVCEALADYDQRDPDRLILPFGCVESLPPADIPAGKRARYVDGAFVLEDLPPPPPPPPAPTTAELQGATLAKARSMRLPVLSILDGLQASALVTAATVLVGDPPVATPLAQVIEDLKQGLRDLPNTVDLSACTTREEMEAVVLTAYYTLANSAPAQVQSAFNSLVV